MHKEQIQDKGKDQNYIENEWKQLKGINLDIAEAHIGRKQFERKKKLNGNGWNYKIKEIEEANIKKFYQRINWQKCDTKKQM